MKFFSLDSPLMKVLNKMTDILWLNILTLLLCIPVVTAGAAFTALHYVSLKMARDEEGYITKDYFKSFKENFKQATIIWIIALLLIVILVVDYFCIRFTSYPTFMFASITAAAVLLYCTLLYVFPVLSHFENNIRGTIKNSFFMSILALPRTVLMIVLTIVPPGVVWLVWHFETMGWLVPLAFLFWFSAPAYFSAKLYSKTFKRFEPEQEAIADDYSWSVNKDEGDEANTDVAENSTEV